MDTINIGWFKGDIAISYIYNPLVYHVKDRHNVLPNEIVQAWEPIFEEKEIKKTFNFNGIEIVVSSAGIIADGHIMKIQDIRNLLYSSMRKIGTTDTKTYDVELTEAIYKIGCSTFKLSQLKQIIDYYETLRK